MIFNFSYLIPISGGCRDSDDGETDFYGFGCESYHKNPTECGSWDDDDFESMDLCCVCKRGFEMS